MNPNIVTKVLTHRVYPSEQMDNSIQGVDTLMRNSCSMSRLAFVLVFEAYHG